jgi:acetyltransferase
MTIRNLHSFFAPKHVALIGASERPGSLGAVVLRNLRQGGFKGVIWPVNPKRAQVQGLQAWPDISSLPQAPDMAIICTPPQTVVALVEQLGARGTRAVIVVTAGLKQPDPREPSRSLEQSMLEAARPHLLRIIGPNCIGVLVPALGLNASFAPAQALPGHLAFVTQSGALATAMLDWANERGIGFSHFVSLGDSADADFGDLLDYLATDASTRAILLYIESVRQARKFMSAARAAARNKPVILVKAGRAPEGARAAASHTGALAGSDLVFDAAVRRAGMLRVDTLEALFDAAQTLAHFDYAAKSTQLRPPRARLAILTNGGGAGVLAADALSLGGGQLATLVPATCAELAQCLPATWSGSNPVDIIGDAPVERYLKALNILVAAEEVDGILFMHAPTAVVPAAEIAAACLPILKTAGKPVLSSWLGGASVAQARSLSHAGGVASHNTPERAVAAWLQLRDYARNQQLLEQLVSMGLPDPSSALAPSRALLDHAHQQGRVWLGDADSMSLLRLWGVPALATQACTDVEQSVSCAERIGYPVALKLISPQVLHKSDVGGVSLHLNDADQVRQAAQRIREQLASRRPDATFGGYTVQAMARHTEGTRELIVGLKIDPVFGPVLLLGQGGIDVHLFGRHALALPPLNEHLARDLIDRSGIGPLLAAHRGRTEANRSALVDVLLRLSMLASSLSDIAELDVNPLWIDEAGVLAVDARVRLRQAAEARVQAAILPYPRQFEERLSLGAQELLLRPIRPEDGQALQQFYAHSSDEDLRMRFFVARRFVPLSELARYSQIDYDREMTFVLMTPSDSGGARMLGEVRAICDPDNQHAEFAIQVAPDHQARGLGLLLMNKLLTYLRQRGTGELTGLCLLDNRPMLSLARRLGFSVTPLAQGGLAEMRLPLSPIKT